ncbi:MAG: hypothetical protein FD130_1898 [Halothiobacillaceae bacterium]|nr:MAG: hypothetical protein FD130_1898 [Halothiobacillaceae bacterium]
MRIESTGVTQADQCQQLLLALASFGATLVAQSKADVLFRRQMGKERVVLKYHPDAALLGRAMVMWSTDDVAIEGNFTPIDLFKAGNTAQNGGFAAAAGAQ